MQEQNSLLNIIDEKEKRLIRKSLDDINSVIYFHFSHHLSSRNSLSDFSSHLRKIESESQFFINELERKDLKPSDYFDELFDSLYDFCKWISLDIDECRSDFTSDVTISQMEELKDAIIDSRSTCQKIAYKYGSSPVNQSQSVMDRISQSKKVTQLSD